MAAAPVDDVMLSVQFGTRKLPLYVHREDTISYVVKKAVTQLKEPGDKKWTLVYKGSAVSEDLKVGVSSTVETTSSRAICCYACRILWRRAQ